MVVHRVLDGWISKERRYFLHLCGNHAGANTGA